MSKQQNKLPSFLLPPFNNAEIVKQTPPKPNTIIKGGDTTPPSMMGPQRFHYYYSAVLPQLHLTLVSVLQGIAFGVLLLGVPLPHDATRLPAFEFLFQQYFYLPYIISSLVILSIWKQFVAACMFATWPLSTLQIGLIYSIALTEIMSFRAISVPPSELSAWLIWLGLVSIIGGCIRLNNLRLETEEYYEAKDVYEFSLKAQRYNGSLYIGLGIIVIALGLLYNQMVEILKYKPHLASLIPWSIYISLTLLLCALMVLDIRNRRSFLHLLLKNSGFITSEAGVLRYRKEKIVLVDQYGNPIQSDAYGLMQAQQKHNHSILDRSLRR